MTAYHAVMVDPQVLKESPAVPTRSQFFVNRREELHDGEVQQLRLEKEKLQVQVAESKRALSASQEALNEKEASIVEQLGVIGKRELEFKERLALMERAIDWMAEKTADFLALKSSTADPNSARINGPR